MPVPAGQLGWGHWGRAPPPAFHTLAKDMSLNRGATHFTLVLSHPSYFKYTCTPLSKLLSCAPGSRTSVIFQAITIESRKAEYQAAEALRPENKEKLFGHILKLEYGGYDSATRLIYKRIRDRVTDICC